MTTDWGSDWFRSLGAPTTQRSDSAAPRPTAGNTVRHRKSGQRGTVRYELYGMVRIDADQRGKDQIDPVYVAADGLGEDWEAVL